MTGVQFRGKENVLKAFESRGVDVWGIWLKKTLNWKGVGAGDLSRYLEMLEQNGAGDIYTLKVFEDLDDATGVKENTPADGSFNFTLYPGNGGFADSSITRYEATNNKNKLFERLELIEEKLAGLPGEDEPVSIEKTIVDILQDPQRLQQYVNVGRSIMGLPTTQNNYPAAMGNVSTANNEETQEQRVRRLSDALNILEQHDPEIVEHLEKLAMMAQDNPNKFKGLLSMLQMF